MVVLAPQDAAEDVDMATSFSAIFCFTEQQICTIECFSHHPPWQQEAQLQCRLHRTS